MQVDNASVQTARRIGESYSVEAETLTKGNLINLDTVFQRNQLKQVSRKAAESVVTTG